MRTPQVFRGKVEKISENFSISISRESVAAVPGQIEIILFCSIYIKYAKA